MFSLLGQGLTMKPLLKILRVGHADLEDADESHD
jgi:hypothetical protein